VNELGAWAARGVAAGPDASAWPAKGWAYRAGKRAFDAGASALALLLLGVPMLLIALAIRLESRGAALFRQRRTGWRGRPFHMLKFRTMQADADAYGASPRSGDDPRLTRIGRLLREASLDELPQLLNVLAGQMSLVGPRPLYERQAELWDDRQRRRLDVRPGITGYAQAYGRASMVLEDKIEFDLYYVRNAGFGLDVEIVLRTLTDVLMRRAGGVYERRYSRRKERETDRQA
jgi:lipopolysaccharide/colanic/teichoic acid biosynthesis glycosyltransferase